MYALQEPQFVQLSLLPTYQLPSDKIVIEWVYSKRRCLPTSKCIFAVDMRQRNIKTCLTGCINAVVDRGNMLGRGSILRIIEEDTHDTLNIEIDSRIKLLNNSQVGQVSIFYYFCFFFSFIFMPFRIFPLIIFLVLLGDEYPKSFYQNS